MSQSTAYIWCISHNDRSSLAISTVIHARCAARYITQPLLMCLTSILKSDEKLPDTHWCWRGFVAFIVVVSSVAKNNSGEGQTSNTTACKHEAMMSPFAGSTTLKTSTHTHRQSRMATNVKMAKDVPMRRWLQQP